MLPQTAQSNPPTTSQPPTQTLYHTKSKISLRAKFSIIIILISILSPTLESLISFHTIYLPLYPPALVLAILGVLATWYLLKPLNKLFIAAKLFAKGELTHKIDIKTGDEIEDLASEFNQMAQNLGGIINDGSLQRSNVFTEKEKLNTIISSLGDGVIVLNIHKQVVLANRAAETITGLTFSEMSGKDLDQLFTISTKDGQLIPSKDFAPIQIDTLPPKFETKDVSVLTNQKGVKRNIRLIGSPIQGNIQADLGCILLLHDASPEKELESIQLDFVSMASHELRTPLTSILGYLNVFMDENKQKLNDTQRESLSRILISAQQLNGLIDNLLSVSKVERGAFAINAVPIDWKQLLTKLVQDNQIQALQKNISLKLELPETEIPKVSVDPIRITEVINNLINNAINYTSSGGTIIVSTQVNGSDILTSVKDTGVGISKEAQTHLFTKFFRVSGALDQSSNSKGTGLGLYISKSVIDLHKGKIWVQSEPGVGSTFSFSLPLNQA